MSRLMPMKARIVYLREGGLSNRDQILEGIPKIYDGLIFEDQRYLIVRLQPDEESGVLDIVAEELEYHRRRITA